MSVSVAKLMAATLAIAGSEPIQVDVKVPRSGHSGAVRLWPQMQSLRMQLGEIDVSFAPQNLVVPLQTTAQTGNHFGLFFIKNSVRRVRQEVLDLACQRLRQPKPIRT